MQKRVSWYDILQVSPRASAAQIKAAYRSQALRWHPDRNPQDRRAAAAQFARVAQAYAILGNSGLRRQYDRLLRRRLKRKAVNDNRGRVAWWTRAGALMKEIFWPLADTGK